MHIVKNERPLNQRILIKIIAFLIAVIICSLLVIFVTHLNPIEVFKAFIKGSFASKTRIINCFRDVCFLWLVAIGLSPSYKMSFFNNGGEGQILMGALFSSFIMINFADKLNNFLLIILMLIFALIGGAIWGFIPVYFNVKYQTNETLLTLMLNYIATQIVEFMVDIWDKKQAHSVGIINATTKKGWLTNLFNIQYSWVFIIVIIIAIIMYIYFKYTKHGYEISVVGESVSTAKYSGINVNKVKIRTVLLSSMICAFAGFLQVSAISHTISATTANGRGFTAIIVAFLGKFSIGLMGLFSFIICFLEKGANTIASQFNFNEYGADVLVGLILLFLIASEFFCNYKIVFKKKGEN